MAVQPESLPPPSSIRSIQRASHLFPRLLLLLVISVYILYFANLTLVRYAAFESRALDMGNLNQAVWNTQQGRWFHLTNQPGTVNRLSLHVEPILLPISWLYWIHPGPETLLVLQATVVALGALPLYLLARLKLRHEWIALAVAVAYLLNPSIQAANWLEFHPVTLAPTFLLATFYFLFRGNNWLYALFALLATSCKEEIGLLVFMIGGYATLALRRVRLGLITMVAALAWSIFAVFVVQNFFAAGNIHWGRYAYLGDTPLQMATTLLTQPDVILAQLRAASASGYLALLLLPVGFTALLAPEILLLALPSLAINLLADFPPMHQVDTLIYAAPIVPFVMVASVLGIARLSRWSQGWRWPNSQPITLSAAAVLLLAGALVAQVRYGYTPVGGNHRTFAIDDHDRAAAALIAAIPPDAKVSAQDRLNPHVSGRETVYIFPRIDDADTIFVDVTGPAWPQHPNDLKTTIDQLRADGFGIAAASDGYLLLSKQATTTTLPAEFYPADFYSAWRRPDYQPADATSLLEVDGRLRLLDYAVEADAHGELVVKLYWQALQPISDDVRIYIAYTDRDSAILQESQFYPPVASLWYPTSQWLPGEPVLVQTLPWRLEEDYFVLMVGAYLDEDGWANGNRLPLTAIDPTLPLLENDSVARLDGLRRLDDGTWQSGALVESEPADRLNVTFGDEILLEGATLEQQAVSPGENLEFSLHWRAIQPPIFDYAVFAHLLDADGAKVAQLDWQPQDAIGRLPATAWIVDQPVVDSQSIPLPAQLPAGTYRLIVGLYNWQNGVRVATNGPDAGADDAVTVAVIEVK
ncbi:MAG: DUF2079 domain-containing protein [Caldilineaceae bacterium]|nr:DUF2079 domain-containing protein [Caldilineaceae bacterium]